ncbi:hypothetical protein NDU88_006108 [Pleurodeles waltl]|uniref:Uncharacterized protein n=1 Tax=Pleurodeles waltl TaxID=8319 RepID=A0AAV7LVZ9_PLEWA|nr:hypothetical protein NDU88_006108 [Pleurodeles waltl]
MSDGGGGHGGGAHWSWVALEVKKVRKLTSRVTLRGSSVGSRGSTSEKTEASFCEHTTFELEAPQGKGRKDLAAAQMGKPNSA